MTDIDNLSSEEHKDKAGHLRASAFALRKGRLLEIKREVSDMMKRCA
jgi:hypothetical protein